MKPFFLSLILFPFSALAAENNITISVAGVTPRGCPIDVRVQGKPGPKGDVLFFPGFADCKDNHDALFRAWEAKGYRVISFNYPEHGTVPRCKGIIFDTLRMKHIKTIAKRVEAELRNKDGASGSAPLTLAGWSTGGLLAAKAEKENWFQERKVQGMLLFAPAVSVDLNPFKNREVSLDTLAPGAKLRCPIQPKAPETVGLGGEIAASAIFKDYSPRVPTLSILASNKDEYIDAAKVKDWMRRQSNVYGYQCLLSKDGEKDVSYHGPDITPGVSEHAIAISSAFLGELGKGGRNLSRVPERGPCAKISARQSARDSGGSSGMSNEEEESTGSAR